MNKSKHIKSLRRRAEFLRRRTEGNPDLSFDRAELSALYWALEELTKPDIRQKG